MSKCLTVIKELIIHGGDEIQSQGEKGGHLGHGQGHRDCTEDKMLLVE